MQKNFTVAESVKYLIGELVVFVRLHDTRIIDQQRPVVDWPQAELRDACARLTICRRLFHAAFVRIGHGHGRSVVSALTKTGRQARAGHPCHTSA